MNVSTTHNETTGRSRLVFDGTGEEINAVWSAVLAIMTANREDSAALTRDDLQRYAEGQQVEAGHWLDDRRNERVRWERLWNGRWQPVGRPRVVVDEADGVSSLWLANNRRPTAVPDVVAP